MEALKQIIEQSFGLRPEHFPPEVQNSVDEVIKLLQQGKLRVAEKIDGEWVTHEWIKKAVLLSFQLYPNKMVRAGDLSFFDKVPSRFDHFSEADWKESGIRCVPTAVARHGSYIAPSVVLMPSFVNIGAYIGENTMVDTWSTVGSCAQVGKNCHLSGGVGIGGVLEPLQATPTIIEDNCFIGARSEIVEGVIVEENSVISMGVFIGQSTKIYDRTTGEIHRGRVPAGSVVVPGSLPSADGKYNLNCAVIVKRVDAKTLNTASLVRKSIEGKLKISGPSTARGPRYFSLPVMWMLCRRVQTAGSFLRLCQRKMRASYTDAVLRT